MVAVKHKRRPPKPGPSRMKYVLPPVSWRRWRIIIPGRRRVIPGRSHVNRGRGYIDRGRSCVIRRGGQQPANHATQDGGSEERPGIRTTSIARAVAGAVTRAIAPRSRKSRACRQQQAAHAQRQHYFFHIAALRPYSLASGCCPGLCGGMN